MKKLVSVFLALVLLAGTPIAVRASHTTDFNDFFVLASGTNFDDFEESSDIVYLSKENVQQMDGFALWVPKKYWTHTRSVVYGMTWSGNTARVTCDVQAYNQKTKMKATVTLKQYSSGGWVNVGSWSGNGTFYCAFSAQTRITTGQIYRVQVKANLYDSNNNLVETITVTPAIYQP